MNIVFGEIKKLILPCFALSLLLFGLFACFGYGKSSIFVTIILSAIYSLVNFWVLGAAISTALSRSPTRAQIYMVLQYLVRYVITGCIIYYAVIIPFINPLAVAIPMFFPKMTLILRSLKI
ncbi:MAG: ATP synthase subunit I [Clostridia bacterium]